MSCERCRPDPRTIMCSCGFRRSSAPHKKLRGLGGAEVVITKDDVRELTRLEGFSIMDEQEIQLKWGGWKEEQQESYRALVTRAKQFEIKPCQAATWSINRLHGGPIT